MKKIAILLIVICGGVHAENFYGGVNEYKLLSNKNKQLINECASHHKIEDVSTYSIISPPLDSDSRPGPVMDLVRLQWNKDHGGAKIVIRLSVDTRNRFNEKVSSTSECKFYGNEYVLLPPGDIWLDKDLKQR